MRVIINGKACQLPDGTSVADLKKSQPNSVRDDQIVRQEGQSSHVLKDAESLKDGDQLYSIPKIIKGDRLQDEVSLLRSAAGTRSEVVLGKKTVGKVAFHAVLIKNVSVPPERFEVTRTDVLFLLPPQYPALPPIGCYLNYKWKTADKHFILRGHHSAPSLDSEGWYWYCVGLGGGFDSDVSRVWRPGTHADNGHNLVSLFAAARHAIRNEEE